MENRSGKFELQKSMRVFLLRVLTPPFAAIIYLSDLKTGYRLRAAGSGKITR